MEEAGADIGMTRAGQAFVGRRRELGITQRELAKLKLISASSLIQFEKGRSWPREKTLAKLEELVRWPAGTIAAIRAGGAIPGAAPAKAEVSSEGGSPIVEALDVALNTIDIAIRGLPDPGDAGFGDDAATVLGDLRKLEAIAARALRQASGSPALVAALSRIRRRYHDLMLSAARSPHAAIGQRLYAARSTAGLSLAETAAALDVPPELVAAIEAGTVPEVDVATAISGLITQLVEA